MCNTMAPMIIILILIASIAAITEEAVNIDSDTDLKNAHIDKLLETLRLQNLRTVIIPKHNGLDVWMMFQLRPRLDPLQKLPNETAKAEPVTSQHDAGRRNRRQIDDKIISGDGGSSSVASLASSSSSSNINGEDIHPVSVDNWKVENLHQIKIEEMNQIRKPVLGNRRRRLASGAEISSKNNTESADPPLSNDEHNMSALKCLLSLSYPVSIPTQCIQFYFRSLFKAIH